MKIGTISNNYFNSGEKAQESVGTFGGRKVVQHQSAQGGLLSIAFLVIATIFLVVANHCPNLSQISKEAFMVMGVLAIPTAILSGAHL